MQGDEKKSKEYYKKSTTSQANTYETQILEKCMGSDYFESVYYNIIYEYRENLKKQFHILNLHLNYLKMIMIILHAKDIYVNLTLRLYLQLLYTLIETI